MLSRNLLPKLSLWKVEITWFTLHLSEEAIGVSGDLRTLVSGDFRESKETYVDISICVWLIWLMIS